MRTLAPTLIGLIAITAALSGCAFVSPGKLDEKIDDIDADGDGVPGSCDCDDANPLRRPAIGVDCGLSDPQVWDRPDWVETPYDGLDNNCDGLDIVDADQDSFPEMPRAEYAAAAVAAGHYDSAEDVPWPQSVFEAVPDCDDTNPDVFPDAPETFHNGIDEDCGGDNDFDEDGDGQMPDFVVPADVTAYADAIGITIDVDDPNAFADCNDNDPDIYAGNPVDAWYDGEDSNCSGNNDFDADGDGYMPNGFATAFDNFVEAYYPDVASRPSWASSDQEGDCVDQDVAALALPAADINPGVVDDVAYDGVDADCNGSTDYDADGDGYYSVGRDAEVADYVVAWSSGQPPAWQPTLISLDEVGGDCNDSDPSVAPGEIELLGDVLDSDCDGEPDQSPMAFATLSWEKPSWPRVVRNDSHYLVVTDALWAVRLGATSSTELPYAASNIFFDADPASANFPAYEAQPLNVRNWANTNPNATDPRSIGVDVVAAGETMFVGNTYYSQTNQTPIFKMGFVQRSYNDFQIDYADVDLANRINTFYGFDSDTDVTFVPSTDPTAPADAGWLFMTMCGGSGRDTPYAGPTISVDNPPTLRQMVIEAPFVTAPTDQVVPISPDPLGDGTIEIAERTDGTLNTADICWGEVSEDAGVFTLNSYVCDIDDCDLYTSTVDTTVDPPVGTVAPDPVPQVDFASRGILEADVHDDLRVLVQANGVEVTSLTDGDSWLLFEGEPVLSADAVVRNGHIYVVAVVAATPLNQVQLAYGPADDLSLLTTSVVSVADDNPSFRGGIGCDPATLTDCTVGRELDPQTVGLLVDDARVVVTVSSWTPDGYVVAEPTISGQPIRGHDAVGWVFYGPPVDAAPPPAPAP